jgi:ABC-type branched-subunit amino acid transport system substrate-binding protein|tara:strand:+ start:110 stop:1012 length:903 start_codon:yes stop_codon:yes gene_type:complete
MLLLLAAAAAAGQTANMAVLWRRENGTMNSVLWDQVACVAVLAVNHFNARNGAVVPEFADVPAGLQLNGLYYDAYSTGKRAIMAYRKAIADGAHIIAGPSRSAQAIPTSQLAAIDEVIINSPWASSPRLSETSVHPYFGRVWPSDSLTASMIMEAMTSFGWRKVGYVGVMDGYAEGFREAMFAWSVANADRVGGVARLQSAPAFSFNNPAAATEAVGLLQTIGANINVVIVFDEDVYATMEAMNEQGLLGPDYVTVISDTTTTASTGAAYIPAHGSADKLAEWLRGAIRVYWPRPHWAHP